MKATGLRSLSRNWEWDKGTVEGASHGKYTVKFDSGSSLSNVASDDLRQLRAECSDWWNWWMSDAFNWGVLGPRLYPLAQSKFCGQYWGTVLEAGTDELDNAWVRVQFTNITTVLYLNHNSTYLNLAKALLERRLRTGLTPEEMPGSN